MFKTYLCVVSCVHLFIGTVFVASLRKRGRIVSFASSVLTLFRLALFIRSVVALILNQFEGEVECGKTSS
jgi:hypothetical protein